MSETYDRLPPDQRAVLSLVLERGKSYAEVAGMLSIPETAVRERAHAALDALAVGGAATPGPTGPGAMPSRPATAGAQPARTAPPAPPAPSESTSARASHNASRLPGSRTGGALLLAGIVVVVVVAVVLIASSGGKGASSGTAVNRTRTGTTTSPASGSARIDKKLTLAAVDPESPASGEAYVLSDGGRHAFYVTAQHLPPSHGFFYAVWLYNSPSSSAPLGRAPSVGSNGRMEGGGPLPSNAADYAKLIVTRETNTRARHPGTIVLSGDFALH
jgi:hypothetical protein